MSAHPQSLRKADKSGLKKSAILRIHCAPAELPSRKDLQNLRESQWKQNLFLKILRCRFDAVSPLAGAQKEKISPRIRNLRQAIPASLTPEILMSAKLSGLSVGLQRTLRKLPVRICANAPKYARAILKSAARLSWAELKSYPQGNTFFILKVLNLGGIQNGGISIYP